MILIGKSNGKYMDIMEGGIHMLLLEVYQGVPGAIRYVQKQ